MWQKKKFRGLICSATFAFGIVSIGSHAAAAEAVLIQSHGEWNSRVVAPGTPQVRFRATSTFQDGASTAVLAMDRLPANCSAQYFTINVPSDTAATATSDMPSARGAMRIDEQPIHNIDYQLGFEKGETTFFVTIMSWDKEETFLSELLNGKSLRFKLTQGKTDYFLNFSLSGYAAAQARTKELCGALKRSDSDFFNKKDGEVTAPKKTDKSYFPL